MSQVDVRGLSCPLPLMKTKKAIDSDEATIMVLADSGTAKMNVETMLADYGYEVTVEDTDDGYRIVGTRSSSPE